MWREFSSVNAVNLAKKAVIVNKIINFSYGIVFYWHTMYVKDFAWSVRFVRLCHNVL